MQCALDGRDARNAVVEDSGRQRGIRATLEQSVGKVGRPARATARNDGYADRIDHRAGEGQVVAAAPTVAVGAGDEDRNNFV